MNGASLKDLGLLWPELILVGAALALILAGAPDFKSPLGHGGDGSRRALGGTGFRLALVRLRGDWIWRHDHGGRILPIL